MLKIWCTRQSLIHIKKQGKFLQGKAVNIFDYIFETGVAYLEFLLQPDPVDCGFKFGYFFVKTKIDVALEFYLKLFTSLISSSFPGRFFF